MEAVTCPLLIEIQGLLAGSSDVEKLGELIERTLQDLGALREDFLASVAREKEATRRIVGREIQAVEQAFEDYTAVLDSAAGYLQGFDRSYLESAARNLPLAITRLDLDFLAYREAAMAERGPTTHPGINYLAALVALSLAGPGHEPEFEAQLGYEVGRAEMGLQEAGDDSLGGLRRQFYQRYLAHLEACPGPADRAWLDGLLALGRDYTQLDLATLERRFGWTPTPVPAINLVVNAVWLWSQQRVAQEVCLLLLQQAHAFVLETLESHTQLAAALPAEDRASQAAHQASASLERLLDILEAYQSWMEAPHAGELDELASQAIASAQALAAARETLQAPTGQALACNICGLANPQGAARCTQCGSKLAAVAFDVAEEVTREAVASVRIQKLLEVAGQVIEGWAQADALVPQLQSMRQSLEVARRKARPPEDLTEADRNGPLGQAATAYSTALDEFEEGLDDLQAFAEDPSREVLEKATQLLTSAGEKLLEVQQSLAPLAG